MSSQYRDNLIDHARRPRGFGVLAEPTFVAHQANPSCGDAIDLAVHVTSEGVVDELMFTGVGCVISLAASSLFMENMKGKKLEELLALAPSDMVRLLGTEIAPLRMSCASLPLAAFRRGYEVWKKA